MLSIGNGYSVKYLTDEVAKGRENYYTDAVAAGEPPGRWYGSGAAKLGLAGLVDEQDMRAVYECFVDPRDEAFKDPARWAEASTLGHTGRKYPTADELYAAALDAEPGATAERREELRLAANKSARQNVAFLDATFSVQKSVTVLHTAFEAQQVKAERTAGQASDALAAAVAAGAPTAALERQLADARTAADSWRAHRDAVEDAIWAGNRAALDYLAEHAGYSRVGHHGGAAGRFIDAHDFVVASFFQHDSRNHDPQLHIHNAILNRVQGTDGKWRTIDGRALYAYRGAAAAVGERTMEEHLSRALGVRFAARPDGKSREIVGIEQRVMDLFSSRRRAITKKTAKLVEQFEAKFGREPNSLELNRLQMQATLATRKSKTHDGETTEARLERWDRELRAEVADGLAGVAQKVLTLDHGPRQATRWSPDEVLKTALADVQSTKAGWTAPDLTRKISDALPDQLGDLDGAQIAQLLDSLTEAGLALATPLTPEGPGAANLPDELKLANGRSVYDGEGRKTYATPEHIHTERALVAAASRRGAPALEANTVTEFVAALADQGLVLGADQAAAVRGALTSGAAVESLVGPAGTGKSFVVGALAKAWQDPQLWGGKQFQVVGLASSQVATDVLAGEGLTARNITRWLHAQSKLAEGSTHPEHEAWRLSPGDLVVVDESAMANTADLAAIHHHAEQAGAKLLLTGDHRQLAAVGAGGGMDLMAGAGAAYELTEVRRFDAEWERAASLRLREGDETVLGDYHKHGRIIDGGTREQAEAAAGKAWLADTLAGKHSVLIVDTNEQAAHLSAELRNELVRLGKVAEAGVPLGMQGTYAGVGDLVQARMNQWNLFGVEGNTEAPINRKQYRVLDTREDGGLIVAHVLGREDGIGEILGERITLPGSYVSEHMTLGYASTVHSAQGLTVDTSHAVATTRSRLAALYVGLTRGRFCNTAHVATVDVAEDAPDGAALDAVKRTPAAVLGTMFDTAEAAEESSRGSALQQAAAAEARNESIQTPVERLADATEKALAGRTSRWLDELTSEGTLTDNQRARIAAEDGAPTLARLLRRAELAGNDPRQVLVDAVAARDFTGARQLTNVIHDRIRKAVPLEPIGTSYTDWLPQVDDPQYATYLHSLATTADQRARQLGEQLADRPQQWALDAFGPVPPEPEARDAWIERAAVVAAHRELTGHTDETAAIGPAPKPGQPEAHASWLASWRTLGRPESGTAEEQMSDGRLLMRVRAWEREKKWGPEAVGHELAGTRQALDRYRRDATLRRTEADTATDDAERARLLQQAADAEALADMLDQRAAALDTVDQARGLWLAHTAETRAAADRAQAQLNTRAVEHDPVEQVTAEEWAAAHREHLAAEDPYRAITAEHDLTGMVSGDHEVTTAEDQFASEEASIVGQVETGLADMREIAAEEPSVVDSEAPRVASAAETAASIEHAQRALREVQARDALDAQHEAEQAQAGEMHRRLVVDANAAELADDEAAVAS